MSWAGFRDGVTEFGRWFVTSVIWVRDQFTFLKGEHIRSIAFLYLCWQGERSWRAIPDHPYGSLEYLLHPHFIICVICVIGALGLAWQATSAKVQVAGFPFSLGAQGDAADSLFAQDMGRTRERYGWGDGGADEEGFEPILGPHHGDDDGYY